MICPVCGQRFNVNETRADFNSFGRDDPTISYDDIPEKMCYNCARQYVDDLFEKEMNDNGYYVNKEDGEYYEA